MPKCSTCGGEINWIKTQAGKSMPVDPNPVAIVAGAPKPDTSIVTHDGRVVRGTRASQATGSGPYVLGFISHFATCPGANQHRRKGEAAACSTGLF